MSFYDILQGLDDSSFLGFRIWEFSYRSLRRRYGLTFLSRVMLRHPLKSLTGALRYRGLLREGREADDVTCLFTGSETEFVSRAVAGTGDLLVSVGFCQKPLSPPCPAGRPNHDCLYLEQLDLREDEGADHPACHRCGIGEIGVRALQAGANMHIMTSALDVARDVMVPSIERGRFGTAVMCLCPYSVQAISLPLTICGIEAFLMGYASGNCMDYREWLEADRGLKGETTALSSGARDRILTLLQTAAERRQKEGVRYHRYVRRGNIYVPMSGQLKGLRRGSKAV